MEQSLIPTPDSIPVNWWWFQILLSVTFFIHLLLVNLIVGGSLISSWDLIRKRTFQGTLRKLPVLIALTINFGIPPLLFVQVLYGHFFYSSSVMMAVPWILVIPILILAYYASYITVYRVEKMPTMGKISTVISTLLLLYIAFMFVNNSTLAINPSEWKTYFTNAGGTMLNLGDPTLFPRYLHFVNGTLAVAGLALALYFQYDKKTPARERMKLKRRGLRIFRFATILQIIIGVIFLFTLPKNINRLFLGGNWIYTTLLILGVIIALVTIYLSVQYCVRLFKQETKVNIWNIGGLILLLIALMIGIRELVRQAYLGNVFHPSALELKGQTTPLIAFLVIFITGLGLIYFMIRLGFSSKRTSLNS